MDQDLAAESGLVESRLLRAMLATRSLPPKLLAAAALRLEGGQMRSRTLRRLLWRHNGVRVGAYTYGGMLQLTNAPRHGLVIDRYVSLSFTARWGINHEVDRISMSPVFQPEDGVRSPERLWGQALHIHSDAWIGDFAVITGTCRRIGVGAVVGAGAIVTRDVPDFAVVTGVPAQVRRYRFPENVHERILASRWWELDLEDLKPWRRQFGMEALAPEALDALAELAEARRGRVEAPQGSMLPPV